MLEQRAAEFLLRADDVEGASFTRPTNACRLVCAHLTALYKEAVQHMDGTNLVSFMSEVNSRVNGRVSRPAGVARCCLGSET